MLVEPCSKLVEDRRRLARSREHGLGVFGELAGADAIASGHEVGVVGLLVDQQAECILR